MKSLHAILLSQDLELLSLCERISQDISLPIENKSNLANFLLDLQENEYQLAMLDCKHMDSENLKWVKVVHRTRPKIPLIIISDNVDQKTGGRVYEEGTFYLYQRPIVAETFTEIILAAIKPYGELK